MSLDDLIRDRLESLVEPLDAPDELAAEISARAGAGPGRTSRRWLLAAVAASVVVVGILGAVSLGREPTRDLTAGPDTSSVTEHTAAAGEVRFVVLGMGEGADPAGTIRAASDMDELAQLWQRAGLDAPSPQVDFDAHVVVALTIPDDACAPTLDRFDVDGDIVEPVFVEPPGGCEEPYIPKTFVVALEWETTGPTFVLRLPGNPTYRVADAMLEFDRATGTPASSEPVAARLELPSTQIPAGSTLDGAVVVENNTSEPIRLEGCGSPYAVELHGVERSQATVSSLCLGVFVLPIGESVWPVTINASELMCTLPDGAGDAPPCDPDGGFPALPPGTYQARVVGVDGAPAVPDVTVELTP